MCKSYLVGLAMVLFVGAVRADVGPEVIAANYRAAVVGLSVANGQRPRPDDRSDESTSAAIRYTTKGVAVGAGVLISADGLILTVASLLDLPGEISVSLDGGAVRKATLVGKDQRTGIALLRIAGPTPNFVGLLAPALPVLGERLVAVGRTALEDESFPVLSEGIVSAVVEPSIRAMSVIQSTAQILPGMGGGPLVSQKTGQVVGINSMIYLNRSSGASMAFAIPVREFLQIRDQLVAKGRISRSAIGISATPLQSETRTALGLQSTDGVLISAVRDAGAAAKAGMQQGDIVLKADGAGVRTVAALFQAIAARDPGTVLELVVFRLGNTTLVNVTREELADK